MDSEDKKMLGLMAAGTVAFIFGSLACIFYISVYVSPDVCVIHNGSEVYYGNKAYVETKSVGSQTQVKITRTMFGILENMYTGKDTVVTTECGR